MKDYPISSFIPISRTIFQHPFWNEKRIFSKFEAWLDLIASARFEESEATELISGKMVRWTRGQFPASLRYLGIRWNWSKTKVNNFIRMLESEKMVKRQDAGGDTVLTLINYDVYNKGQQKGQLRRPQYSDAAEQEDRCEDKEGTVEGQARDKTNKDNKENKEEECMYGAVAPLHSPGDMAKFKAFEKWILENAPKVAKMKQPFTFDQFLKLRDKLPVEQVKDLLLGMENYGPLLKKNDSAYLTIRKWAKRDYNTLKTTNNAISDTAAYLRKRKIQTEQVRKRAAD